MAAAFEAKEPTAAEHALQLTRDLMACIWQNDDTNLTAEGFVDVYRCFYRGILKALKEGVPS